MAFIIAVLYIESQRRGSTERIISFNTAGGQMCGRKLNRGLLVRHVEQTLFSCMYIYFLCWLVNEFIPTIYVFACV